MRQNRQQNSGHDGTPNTQLRHLPDVTSAGKVYCTVKNVPRPKPANETIELKIKDILLSKSG